MLSLTHFLQHLEMIMPDALEEHDGKVSSLRFADDLDALAKEKQELEALVGSYQYKNGIRCSDNQSYKNVPTASIERATLKDISFERLHEQATSTLA